MGKINSRSKGQRGELEVAALLPIYGFKARRGQQHRGGPDSPDVIHSIPNVHIEVKFTEQFSPYAAMDQAIADKGKDEIPVVFHRRKRKKWLVVMGANDFLRIMETFAMQRRRNSIANRDW